MNAELSNKRSKYRITFVSVYRVCCKAPLQVLISHWSSNEWDSEAFSGVVILRLPCSLLLTSGILCPLGYRSNMPEVRRNEQGSLRITTLENASESHSFDDQCEIKT